MARTITIPDYDGGWLPVTVPEPEFGSRQAAAAARGEAVEIDARIIPDPEPEAGQ